MSDIIRLDPQEYNKKLAEALKSIKEFEIPEWARYVKTASSKARPPFDEDFWYKRAASILRQIYKKGNVGVNRLRTRYGSRKNRGNQPERFRRGSGKIIRVVLQQAEGAGFLEKNPSRKGGRRLSLKGKDFLEGIK